MPYQKAWENYEEVAQHLLREFADEFGLSAVERKQSVVGQRSGTKYEIDAKGVLKDGEGFLIVECRRYTNSRQNQEKVGALAYRIIDTGAKGGIIVSPLGLQEGAEKIADGENIHSVILDENSTFSDYVLLADFLKKVFVGVSDHLSLSESLIVTEVKRSHSC